MDWLNIKMIGNQDRLRYVLSKPGDNTLFIIGVNPSTANEEKPDPTMRKVLGFAEVNGFDSFCMLNLYPQRCADPDDLHEKPRTHYVKKNVNYIHDQLMAYLHKHKKVTILAGWGNLIDKRPYLTECLGALYLILKEEFGDKIDWKMIRLSKDGNPIHPLTFKEKYGPFKDFNIQEYVAVKMTDLLPNN